MKITICSIVMALLTSSLLILIIHFAAKSRRLNKYFGLASVIVLYICSIARIALPVEFGKGVIEISESTVYPAVTDFLFTRIGGDGEKYTLSGFQIIDLIMLIWAAGTVVLLFRLIFNYFRFVRTVNKYQNLATPRENRFFATQKRLVGYNSRIELLVIDENISPMTYGVLSPVVLLPCNNYSDEELSFVLKHELTHQKNHDIALKLLIEIYCCLFWWNPLSYLLKTDLAQKLELKCDNRAIKDCTEQEKVDYLVTILKCLKDTTGDKACKKVKLKSTIKNSLVSSELAAADSAHTRERFECILKPQRESKYMSKLYVIALSLICASVLALSYIFIVQPENRATPDDAIWEPGVTFVADENNSYLVEQPDGNYIFYMECPDGVNETYVPQEEVEKGLYSCYPILDSKR